MRSFFLVLFIAIFTSGCIALQRIGSINKGAGQNISTITTPGLGTIKGIIQTDNPTELNGLIVYLGDIIHLGEGFRGGFLDTSRAPYALIDPHTGEFYIDNVQPGTYSLVIYEVVAGGKVYQDSRGNAVEIEVKENQVTDLGIILFNTDE